ncbi:hypothetical protein Syun_010141 [Stephania yunnanensis]|uniref:EXPERA domain-containing protein n=1 Tax=Stephania yunnanensis TaxID=152371 RepID=A0AAP0KIA8_9MAGN
MGLCKLVDALLFLYFLFIVIVSVLFDAQTSIPSHFFPEPLIELKSWYAREFGDYLVSEKPHFFVGLTNVELIVQLPVAIATLYGILARKSWVRTTCLIYGVSSLSTMGLADFSSFRVFVIRIVILTDMIKSKRASEKMLMVYWPFLGVAVLAVLRGLVPCSGGSGSAGSARRSAAPRKKRA